MPKVEFCSPGELEAEEVIAAEEMLSLKPIFYGTGRESTTTAIIKVRDDQGELVHMYLAKISGDSLKIALSERTKPVLPLYEKKKKRTAAKNGE